MTPVEAQIKNHQPSEGLYGDCHRACLASVLDLPIDAVPHFMDGDKYGQNTEERLQAQDEWLAEKGLSYVELPIDAPSLQECLDFVGRYSGDSHWILVAESASSIGHSVVCRGNKIVHDPTYGNEKHGIVGKLLDEETGERWYWMMLITVK